MKPLKACRNAFAVLLTRVGLLIVPRCPRPWIVVAARFLGRAGYGLAGEARRVGRANLDLVWGDRRTAAEKRSILIGSFQTFALVMLDILWFTRRPRERLTRHVSFDPLALAILPRTPLICITAHLGNWETVGQAVPNAGYPLSSVAARVRIPDVDALFIRSRQHTGQTILAADGALRKLLRLLNDGGRFAILLDQNTPPREGGVFVPFFGLPVPITPAVATLALRTRSNLLFGFCLPRRDGTYHVRCPGWIPASEMERLARNEPERAPDLLTAVILHVVERMIEERPECWLWMYKRWKHIAPGISPEDHPFYGKPLGPRDRDKARVSITPEVDQLARRMVRTSVAEPPVAEPGGG